MTFLCSSAFRNCFSGLFVNVFWSCNLPACLSDLENNKNKKRQEREVFANKSNKFSIFCELMDVIINSLTEMNLISVPLFSFFYKLSSCFF